MSDRLMEAAAISAVEADAADFRRERDARLATERLPLDVLATMLYGHALSRAGQPTTQAMLQQAADIISALADGARMVSTPAGAGA